MNKLIVYALFVVAVAIVIFLALFFVAQHKEIPPPEPKIEEALKKEAPPSPKYVIPPGSFPANKESNKELNNESMAPHPKESAFGEALEKKRRVAAQVRAEIVAAMNGQTTGASTQQSSGKEQEKIDPAKVFIHH